MNQLDQQRSANTPTGVSDRKSTFTNDLFATQDAVTAPFCHPLAAWFEKDLADSEIICLSTSVSGWSALNMLQAADDRMRAQLLREKKSPAAVTATSG